MCQHCWEKEGASCHPSHSFCCYCKMERGPAQEMPYHESPLQRIHQLEAELREKVLQNGDLNIKILKLEAELKDAREYWQARAKEQLDRVKEKQDAYDCANRLIDELREYVKTTEYWKLEPADQKERAAWTTRIMKHALRPIELTPGRGVAPESHTLKYVHEWVESAELGTVCQKCGRSYFLKDKPCEVKRVVPVPKEERCGATWSVCGWCAGGHDDPQGTCPKCHGAKGKWIEESK